VQVWHGDEADVDVVGLDMMLDDTGDLAMGSQQFAVNGGI
jgi:hypothetical protein